MQVHEGMMQAATFVHTNAYEALQAAAVRFPGWPVMLTGHSMGGIHSPTIAQTNWHLVVMLERCSHCPPPPPPRHIFDCPSNPLAILPSHSCISQPSKMLYRWRCGRFGSTVA